MGAGGDGSGLGGSHLSRNMQGGARDGPGGKKTKISLLSLTSLERNIDEFVSRLRRRRKGSL